MKKFQIISLVIYPFDVCISINQTDKELKKSMGGQDMTDSECLFNLPKSTIGRAVMLQSNLSIIRIKMDKEIPHSVIAHEIFHIVTFIMERIGMELVIMKSDEAYAYLIGHLTKEVYNVIDKK